MNYGKVSFLEMGFELRCLQLLSQTAQLPGMPCRTTGTPEAALPRSSRTRDNFLSDTYRFHQVETDLSHDGLNPAHVPF
jgi:hypothetical protein